jgi:hypothetical protein
LRPWRDEVEDDPGDDAHYRFLCRDELMAGFRAGSWWAGVMCQADGPGCFARLLVFY